MSSTTPVTSERLATGRRARYQTLLAKYVQVAGIAAMLLVLVIVFSATANVFLTSDNLLNVVRQSAPTMIAAVAMTFVITTAGIDLSVGSIVAMISVLSAILLRDGWSPALALVAVLLLGGAVGAANGFFSAYMGVPAFIVTLAGLSIFRGVAQKASDGASVPMDPSWLVDLGQGRVAGIPTPAIIAVAVAAVGWFVLAKTPYGQYVVALGSNSESLRRSGVNIRRIGLSVYVLTGLAAALAGVLVAARLGSGSPNQGLGFELEVITAVVLGGTSLFGGQGSIAGTVLGVLVVAVIGNGLILLHVSPFWVPIVQGLILLLAIVANTRLFARFTRVKT